MTILYTAEKKALAAFTSASLLHTLHNPNTYGTSASDQFGTSEAISGNRVVVGAYREDYLGSDSGSVYVYQIS